MATSISSSSAGLHLNVVQSIERLRRHHHPAASNTARTKHRLALWDVRPLDRKNAKYVVDFLEQQQQDQDQVHDEGNNDNNVVIVSQLVLAYCDLSLEAVQVFSAHFERSSSSSSSSRSHLEKVTLSHLRGLGGGGGGGALSSSPLERLLTALSNNESVTELCLDNVYLLPLVPDPAPQPHVHHNHQNNNNNEDANDNPNSSNTTTTTTTTSSNALGHLLQSNRHVTTLSCSTTNLGLHGILGMQAGLFDNDTLRELDLNDVNLGNAGLEALVRALVGHCTSTNPSTTLTGTTTTTTTIQQSSSKSRIQVLSLCQNQISWRGLPSLARLLQQSKFLKSLILRLNRGILDTTRDDAPNDDEGVAAAAWHQAQQHAHHRQPLSAQACRQVFCKALRDNKTLTMLSLSDCSVRGTSAAMIVQALATTSAKQQRNNNNCATGNTTLQILEMDGFRLDSDVHVCRTWEACLPRITGLRHLTIHLDFGRNPALLAALHENLSLETISRRRDASSSSGSTTSNSNSSGGRRLVRSNSIGSEGSSSSSSATTAAADDAVYSILERNRLARLAQESFGFPPRPSCAAATSMNDDVASVANIITPGILYQSILRVTGATAADNDADDDGTSAATTPVPVMNAAGMAQVLYKILRPRIDIVLSQQQQHQQQQQQIQHGTAQESSTPPVPLAKTGPKSGVSISSHD